MKNDKKDKIDLNEIAAKLKDRVLFPKLVAEAKRILSLIKQ